MNHVTKLRALVSMVMITLVSALTASADNTNLRIQTQFTAESAAGQMVANFIENINKMSNMEIEIQMFYGSAITETAETFDAAVAGIIDCDMTSGAYQTGRDPAFQLTDDLVGLYTNPLQQIAWLIHGDGYKAMNDLYNVHDMEFVGWWIPGPISFSSSNSIGGIAYLKDWRFRTSSNLNYTVFSNLGSSPIIIDFNDIPNAIGTGVLNGAYAANLNEKGELALYDISNRESFPGFHSMPASHLACRKGVWDSMPINHQSILKAGMQSLALESNAANEIKNAQTIKALLQNEVTLYKWSNVALGKYRSTIKSSLTKFATTKEAKKLLSSHIKFLTEMGVLE